MNRETIIAIVLGISLGLVAGLVVLFQTSRGEEAKVIPIARDNDEKVVTEKKSDSSMTQSNLTILSPNDKNIVDTKEIEIKGKAKKGSLIVVQSAVSQDVIKSEDEDFSLKFTLAPGENQIQISAYSDSSIPQERTISIYYIPQG